MKDHYIFPSIFNYADDRIFLVDVSMPQVRKEVQPLCVLKRSA